MRLSTSIDMFMRYYSLEETVAILSDAGFDAIDFSAFVPEFYNEESDSNEFKERMINLRKMAQSHGMCFNQAHAPHPSSYIDKEKSKDRFKAITRAMRNASYLGAETIVVHPVQHLTYETEGNPEKLFEMNMEFYTKLKPYCEEYNIKVALENMWQQKGIKNAVLHSTCSRPDEFIKYLDTLNSEWFVGCLDTGHASIVKEDVADFIRKLGKKRLKALHIHDVDGINDMHTIPYQGIINWDSVAKALKEIDYEGDFTFELYYFFYNNMPKELYRPTFKYMAEIGRYIMNKIK